LLGVYCFSGFFTPVRFERERIAVHVEPEWIHVSGLYLYRNESRWPTLLTLGIPFPTDDNHGMPVRFALAEADAAGCRQTELAPIGRRGAVRLRLFFRPKEQKWIRLDYTQPTAVPRGRYLLTTTRAWRRPIAQASFRLSLAESLRLTESNYVLTRLRGLTRTQEFEFNRTEFYPTADWEFNWHQATAGGEGEGGTP
jgi:hypothetical protein